MQEEKIIVSMQKGLSPNKWLNLHITVMLLSFMSMVFHFTCVYFFTLELGSLALVGIFLGLGNLFAFLFDVPIWIFQYYFKPKTLYMFGIGSQIVSMLIFANFIFSVTWFVSEEIIETVWVLKPVLSFFLTDALNIVLLVIAAMCYGFTKEVNDITTITYVLNNANPNQYKTIFAKNNIFFWIGSFLWLFVSGIILSSSSPQLIIFHIIFILCMIFFVAFKFFDNDGKVIEVKDIQNFYLQRWNFSFKKLGVTIWDTISENVSEVVSKIDIKQTLKNTKYLILKPSFVGSSKISMKEIVQKTSLSFRDIFETLAYSIDKHLIVYWAFIMLLTFGFWDTFASTFLIDFLNQVKPGWSFALLGLIAIPAFWLQDIFWKLSDKIGSFKLSMFWLFLSSSSLIIMAFFAGEKQLFVVLWLALVNSVWYAICMSLAVANFLETYNIAYADRKWLTQIDANASAAPMKILQNLANVVWLFLGWLILSLAWFAWFFFVFGLFIGWFFVWSIVMRKSITG